MEISTKINKSPTRFVYLDLNDSNNIDKIVVEIDYDEKLAGKLVDIVGYKNIIRKTKNTFYIGFDVKHILPIFSGLSTDNFQFSQEFINVKDQVVEIIENKNNFLPIVKIENSTLCIENVSQHTKRQIHEIFDKFYQKSPQIFAERMRRLYINFVPRLDITDDDLELSKKILTSHHNTFSISPTEYNFEKLWKNIEFLGQKPVAIVLDDNDCTAEKIANLVKAISTTVETKNIAFMFRLDNKTNENIQFNRYLHENGLDSPLNNNTEVAFITRNKISKIFLKYFVSPYSLILMTKHSFGKLKYLVQNSQVTYLYKDSIFNRTGDKFEIMQISH